MKFLAGGHHDHSSQPHLRHPSHHPPPRDRLLALLERLTHRARTVWTATAVVVLVVSFGPLFGPGTATAARIVLALLHLTVAAILILALARSAAAAAAA